MDLLIESKLTQISKRLPQIGSITELIDIPLDGSYLPADGGNLLISKYPELAALKGLPFAAISISKKAKISTTNIDNGCSNGDIYIFMTYYSNTYTIISNEVFTSYTFPNSTMYSAISYCNGLFIASAEFNYLVSIDGIIWENCISPIFYNIKSLVYTGSRYIVTHLDNPTQILYLTPDIRNVSLWYTITVTESYNYGVIAGNSSALVLLTKDLVSGCGYSALLLSIDDGVTWARSGLPWLDTEFGIIYGNSIFLLYSRSGSAIYYTSTDGITWSVRTRLAGMTVIYFYGGAFMAFIPDSTALVSTDGINWFTYSLNFNPYSVNWGYEPKLNILMSNLGWSHYRALTLPRPYMQLPTLPGKYIKVK